MPECPAHAIGAPVSQDQTQQHPHPRRCRCCHCHHCRRRHRHHRCCCCCCHLVLLLRKQAVCQTPALQPFALQKSQPRLKGQQCQAVTGGERPCGRGWLLVAAARKEKARCMCHDAAHMQQEQQQQQQAQGDSSRLLSAAPAGRCKAGPTHQ